MFAKQQFHYSYGPASIKLACVYLSFLARKATRMPFQMMLSKASIHIAMSFFLVRCILPSLAMPPKLPLLQLEEESLEIDSVLQRCQCQCQSTVTVVDALDGQLQIKLKSHSTAPLFSSTPPALFNLSFISSFQPSRSFLSISLYSAQ